MHDPSGITDPVPNVTLDPPAMAVPAPLHVVENAGDAAITTPGGNESTSGDVKVSGNVPGLLKVMVRVETPPALMVAGLKDLLSVGGTGVTAMVLTVSVATAGAPLLPLLVFKAPAASEF